MIHSSTNSRLTGHLTETRQVLTTRVAGLHRDVMTTEAELVRTERDESGLAARVDVTRRQEPERTASLSDTELRAQSAVVVEFAFRRCADHTAIPIDVQLIGSGDALQRSEIALTSGVEDANIEILYVLHHTGLNNRDDDFTYARHRLTDLS